MNRDILCLCIDIVFFATCPAMAQVSGTASTKADSAKTKAIEVKDYKSFTEYVANEEANLKAKPVTTDSGPIRDKLKNIGINFTSSDWARSKDGTKTGFISPDKKGVSIIDSKTKSIHIMGADGKTIAKIPFQKNPTGVPGFSRTRLFDIQERGIGGLEDGFDIYDFYGNHVKRVSGLGGVDYFIVSNKQAYILIVAGSPKTGNAVALFDMDGNEVWKQKIIASAGAVAQFSPDDKYVLLKIPDYWVANEVRRKKLYIFSVLSGAMVAEGNYEN